MTGVHLEAQGLRSAQNRELDRLVFGFLQGLDHVFDRRQRLAIHGNDPVIFLNASFGGGHSRFKLADDNGLIRVPASVADAGLGDFGGNDGLVDVLPVTLDGNVQTAAGG